MPELQLPLIVDSDALERVLGRDNLLVVDVDDEATYAQHHIPDAVHLDYESIVDKQPPAAGLLPDDKRLGDVFSALGLSTGAHVVAYDSEKNSRATRLLWTLDAVGHRSFSLLDGGLSTWLASGHPTESGPASPNPTRYRVASRGAARADKSYILEHLDDPGVVLLDARSPAEFAGEDVRAARGGHIPSAVNIDWESAIDGNRFPRLRPADDLRRLFEEAGVTPDKEVIVYCQTHHRSSHAYIVLKSLGYPRIRGYDGSWSEWGNDPETPIDI
jgi:thiosulfate/3-mercaptopyruvate sulfurtransferase